MSAHSPHYWIGALEQDLNALGKAFERLYDRCMGEKSIGDVFKS